MSETRAALGRLKTAWLSAKVANAELKMVKAQNKYMQLSIDFWDRDKTAAIKDIRKCRMLAAMISAQHEIEKED